MPIHSSTPGKNANLSISSRAISQVSCAPNASWFACHAASVSSAAAASSCSSVPLAYMSRIERAAPIPRGIPSRHSRARCGSCSIDSPAAGLKLRGYCATHVFARVGERRSWSRKPLCGKRAAPATRSRSGQVLSPSRARCPLVGTGNVSRCWHLQNRVPQWMRQFFESRSAATDNLGVAPALPRPCLVPSPVPLQRRHAAR
jgi:hypothetical protein